MTTTASTPAQHPLSATAAPVLGALFAPTFHRPFLRYFDGEQGGGAGGGEQQQEQPQEGANATGGSEGAGDGADASKLDSLTPEQLRAEVTRLRGENAAKRTRAREADEAAAAERTKSEGILASVAKALGLAPAEGAEVTVDGLQASLTEAASKITAAEAATTAAARENAVLRYAPSLGANADRLLDSNAFTQTLSAVDPSDAEAVKTAITAALAKDRSYALVQTAGSSGGTQHTGGDSTSRAKSMSEAAAKRMGFAS